MLTVEDAALRLRDGTSVAIRPLDPAVDREAFLEGFAELSAEARYMRFGAPMPSLSAAMIRALVDHVDGVHHVAIVIETTGGDPVAIGRFVRDARDERRAEVAVTVLDAWQGRGAGTLLLAALRDAAVVLGVTTFTATVLASNGAALRLAMSAGAVTKGPASSGVVEIEVPLAATAGRSA